MAETVRSLGKRSKEEKDWVALAWINLKKKRKVYATNITSVPSFGTSKIIALIKTPG